jgi:protein-disulfide isomerase
MGKEARARTREMQAAREAEALRQKKRQRLLLAVGGVVIVALLGAIIFFVVRAATSDDGGSAVGGTPPGNLSSSGAIPVGAEDAPTTMEIYFDYMCPACGQFEAANGDDIERLVDAGEVKVELRPISFLDRTSNGTRYSTRTANAIATVADGAPEQVWPFHAALYANQPEEGTNGLSDEEIASIAEDAGVPADVIDRFEDLEYDGWVADVTDEAFDSGIEGTPTVTIDGEVFQGDLYTPGVLADALEAAADAG